MKLLKELKMLLESNIENSSKVNIPTVINKKSQNSYATLFSDKFIYFILNSDILYCLVTEADTSVSINSIELLLFQNRTLETSDVSKLIEKYKNDYEFDSSTIASKLAYGTLIINTLYQYLSEALEDFYNGNIAIIGKYNEIEEVFAIKINYLTVIEKVIEIFRQELVSNDEIDEVSSFQNGKIIYSQLVSTIPKKVNYHTYAEINDFVLNIFLNETIIFNQPFLKQLIKEIKCKSCDNSKVDTDKLLMKVTN